MSPEKFLLKLKTLPVDIVREIEEEVDFIDLTHETFDKGQDPYGSPWKPRKKLYSHPIMRKSRNLYRSYSQSIKGKTIEISNTAPYAGYHQVGAGHLPVRKVLPDGEVPKSWQDQITKTINGLIRKKFR